ncbi:zinc finger, CCHC-type containing protein [Tanacetum coccineum]
MKGYMDQLQALGKPYDNDMAINLINRSLNKDFGDFVRNFNMHCVGKTVSDLHALLIDYEKGLKTKALHSGKADKNKQVVAYQPKPKQNPPQKKENPKKDQACHHCNVVGHWKRNCPLYLEELRTNKNKKAEHGAAASDLPILARLACKSFNVKDFWKVSMMDHMINVNLNLLVRILNMVPTKKVDKTPYEIWHGKVYPKGNYGLLFIFTENNGNCLLGYGDFLKEISYLTNSVERFDLKTDHMDTLPSENTSKILVEPESLGPPPELITVCRFERETTHAQPSMSKLVVEDDVVGGSSEKPANYKAGPA